MGFHNKIFGALEKVIDRLCEAACLLTESTIRNIAGKDWILECFGER